MKLLLKVLSQNPFVLVNIHLNLFSSYCLSPGLVQALDLGSGLFVVPVQIRAMDRNYDQKAHIPLHALKTF